VLKDRFSDLAEKRKPHFYMSAEVDSDKTNTPLRNEYSLETGAILSLEMTE
jgi:hypothetical protein